MCNPPIFFLWSGAAPQAPLQTFLIESNSAAELAPLHAFLFEHGEVIGRSSLRFKLLFNRKVILRRSSLRFKLFLIKRKFCGGARSASFFFIRTRETVGRSLLCLILFMWRQAHQLCAALNRIIKGPTQTEFVCVGPDRTSTSVPRRPVEGVDSIICKGITGY